MNIVKIVDSLFYLYYVLIIIRIFLTWIPTIDWHQEPIKSVRQVTDLYLDIFRKFIPPIGGFDFSPIIALIALQIIQVLVVNLVASVFG